MALFERAKSSYRWVRFTASNGEQLRKSAGTVIRRAAQEYEDPKRTALWRQHKLGEKPRYRWQQAVERWVIESAAHASRLQPNPVRRIRWLKHEEADRLLGILPPNQAAPTRAS